MNRMVYMRTTWYDPEDRTQYATVSVTVVGDLLVADLIARDLVEIFEAADYEVEEAVPS